MSERSFRVRVLRQSGLPTQVDFVAGGSDGLPEIDGGASSQSTGIVPSSPGEVWPATDVIDTPTRFHAVSPPMPVPTATFTGFDGTVSRITTEPLTRVITLDADSGVNPGLHHVEKARRIVGGYREEIAPDDPGKTFPKHNTDGFFGLVVAPPPPPEIASPFDPNP